MENGKYKAIFRFTIYNLQFSLFSIFHFPFSVYYVHNQTYAAACK